ncbi:hypothetical protein AX16_000867 [Volvariella volvacea WC 439]|nr:hypothetical protein AX16_000867 [Volvariella volvacea WC 439]
MASALAEFVISSITAVRYSVVASLCLMLYDWIAFFDEEMRLIHRGRWSSVKIAYLLSRYYPLVFWPFLIWGYVGNHTRDVCLKAIGPIQAGLAPFQLIAQAIMLIRAYAFSNRDKRVLALLGTCYLGLFAIDIWVFCVGVIIPTEAYYTMLGGSSACFPDYSLPTMRIRILMTVLATTFNDTISLSVVLYFCWTRGAGRGSLTRYFVNQGLGSFASSTFLSICAMILYFQRSSPYARIGLPLLVVVINLIACRVIIQLRLHASRDEHEGQAENIILNPIGMVTRVRKHDAWAISS